ncbi:tail tape measure protein [Deep-sea thermophilic phage D6E]|uniref:tail tape measure protein n=1 Tax=Deep-sea thermophilic phage D6E TaxID=749413 RepID=UPI0001F390E5|nr:tail tape measure protein [Deep-sea thermophilic phage D6E]ADE87496.1 tail tape measure protein [Deep-sea thermophilic phage D6E]
MFNNQKSANEYTQMLQRVAIDSPVLNSQDMFANSKSFISLTKDIKTLERAWRVVEKLNVMDPAQGVEGAVLAMRELASGDVVSMVERFEMPRSAVKAIKDLPFEEQVKALDQLLSKMHITDKVVQKMGSTTLSQWNRFKEMASIAFRDAGKSANSELGKALQRVNNILEKGALNSFIQSVDRFLGKSIGAIVNFGLATKQFIRPATQFLRENASSIKAVAVALGSLFVIRKVTGLVQGLFMVLRANPLALAVTGIVVAIDKLVGIETVFNKIKLAYQGLKAAFRGDQQKSVNFLQKLGLSPEQAQKVIQVAQTVKNAFFGVYQSISDGGIASAFQTISTVMKPVKDLFVTIGQSASKFVNEVVIPLIPQAKQFLVDAFEAVRPSLKFIIGLFQTAINVIKTLIEKVIVPQFPAVKDIIKTTFDLVTPVIRLANRLFQGISATIMFLVNNVIIPLIPKIIPTISGMWKVVGPVLKRIAAVFNGISDAIEWAIKKFKQFADFVSNFKMPKIGLPKWMGGKGLIQLPGHATGLSRVPYDNYVARLHKDETVLRADQSRALEQAGILDRSGTTPKINSLGWTSTATPKTVGGSVVFSPKVDIHVTAADIKSAGSLEVVVSKKLDEMWKMFLDLYPVEVVR